MRVLVFPSEGPPLERTLSERDVLLLGDAERLLDANRVLVGNVYWVSWGLTGSVKRWHRVIVTDFEVSEPQAYPHERDALDGARVLAENYPSLHALKFERSVAVAGTFRLAEGDVPIEDFLVHVELPPTYPIGLPVALEMGGRIPRDENHQVNKDGTLCVGLPEELWLRYDGRLPMEVYLPGPLRDYFVGVSSMLRGKGWPYGEWGHGARGLREFYGQYIDTERAGAVAEFVAMIAEGRVKGHVLCPCGSEKESRRCHLPKMRSL